MVLVETTWDPGLPPPTGCDEVIHSSYQRGIPEDPVGSLDFLHFPTITSLSYYPMMSMQVTWRAISRRHSPFQLWWGQHRSTKDPKLDPTKQQQGGNPSYTANKRVPGLVPPLAVMRWPGTPNLCPPAQYHEEACSNVRFEHDPESHKRIHKMSRIQFKRHSGVPGWLSWLSIPFSISAQVCLDFRVVSSRPTLGSPLGVELT